MMMMMMMIGGVVIAVTLCTSQGPILLLSLLVTLSHPHHCWHVQLLVLHYMLDQRLLIEVEALHSLR